MSTIQTRDLGLAIADYIEDHRFDTFEDVEGELFLTSPLIDVDRSDPCNLIVCLENGQTFRVTITAGT